MMQVSEKSDAAGRRTKPKPSAEFSTAHTSTARALQRREQDDPNTRTPSETPDASGKPSSSAARTQAASSLPLRVREAEQVEWERVRADSEAMPASLVSRFQSTRTAADGLHKSLAELAPTAVHEADRTAMESALTKLDQKRTAYETAAILADVAPTAVNLEARRQAQLELLSATEEADASGKQTLANNMLDAKQRLASFNAKPLETLRDVARPGVSPKEQELRDLLSRNENMLAQMIVAGAQDPKVTVEALLADPKLALTLQAGLSLEMAPRLMAADVESARERAMLYQRGADQISWLGSIGARPLEGELLQGEQGVRPALWQATDIYGNTHVFDLMEDFTTPRIYPPANNLGLFQNALTQRQNGGQPVSLSQALDYYATTTTTRIAGSTLRVVDDTGALQTRLVVGNGFENFASAADLVAAGSGSFALIASGVPAMAPAVVPFGMVAGVSSTVGALAHIIAQGQQGQFDLARSETQMQMANLTLGLLDVGLSRAAAAHSAGLALDDCDSVLDRIHTDIWFTRTDRLLTKAGLAQDEITIGKQAYIDAALSRTGITSYEDAVQYLEQNFGIRVTDVYPDSRFSEVSGTHSEEEFAQLVAAISEPLHRIEALYPDAMRGIRLSTRKAYHVEDMGQGPVNIAAGQASEIEGIFWLQNLEEFNIPLLHEVVFHEVAGHALVAKATEAARKSRGSKLDASEFETALAEFYPEPQHVSFSLPLSFKDKSLNEGAATVLKNLDPHLKEQAAQAGIKFQNNHESPFYKYLSDIVAVELASLEYPGLPIKKSYEAFKSDWNIDLHYQLNDGSLEIHTRYTLQEEARIEFFDHIATPDLGQARWVFENVGEYGSDISNSAVKMVQEAHATLASALFGPKGGWDLIKKADIPEDLILNFHKFMQAAQRNTGFGSAP